MPTHPAAHAAIYIHIPTHQGRVLEPITIISRDDHLFLITTTDINDPNTKTLLYDDQPGADEQTQYQQFINTFDEDPAHFNVNHDE